MVYLIQELTKPVIFQSLLMGFEARIVGEEFFLEGFGKVKLIARPKLVSEAVWKYDLMIVNDLVYRLYCSCVHTLGPVAVIIWNGPSCSFRPFAIVSVL